MKFPHTDMGCSQNKAIRIYPRKKKGPTTQTDFVIKVEHPVTFEIQSFYYSDENDEELPLI